MICILEKMTTDVVTCENLPRDICNPYLFVVNSFALYFSVLLCTTFSSFGILNQNKFLFFLLLQCTSVHDYLIEATDDLFSLLNENVEEKEINEKTVNLHAVVLCCVVVFSVTVL